KIASAKYHFIVVIESSIDMCNHIISRNGYRVPEDYGDTFRVMREEGAFDTEFSEELVKMEKFRNRLVHLYWEIDDTRIYKILEGNLGDLNKFIKLIAGFLEWDTKGGSK
ncbi:MAG: type VII toxin-antitoxin system HepT family RNase toxin, partial [Planctomycetota bacterium]